MMNTYWSLGAASPKPSPSWETYAERYSGLLTAIAEGLPGGVTWQDSDPNAETALGPGDIQRLTEMLLEGRLRNDLGELMQGAYSSQWLTGRRGRPADESDIILRGGWGGDDDIKVSFTLEVREPGPLLWSYPDDTIAAVVAATLAAIDGNKAKIRDRFLHRLLVRAEAPFDVGSHVYMTVPLDDPARFPPGARQVRCGDGWLLIVPSGASDEGTVQRMRWVAAAIGAA
jgi:hypothetical protein